MSQIQSLIDQREQNFPEKLLEARQLLEAQLAQAETRADALADLCQTLFWLGDYSTDKAKREEYFGQAVEMGKQAVEANPASVKAQLWYAASMGSHGMERGIMSSLFYLGPIEKHGKLALDLDQNYFDAAALRLLGRFYHQAPGWPIGAGDLKKSLQMLQKAVEIAPNFPYNHLYLGEALAASGKKADGKQKIQHVLDMPARPGLELLFERCKADAAEAIKKV
ncbi:MAG: hypothetical protein K1X75_06710 [Leptospirales bacterium]|nr:hypothetical protein [Leptospirales bacterium]